MTARRFASFLPFAALCLLLAVRWIFAEAWPGTQSTASSLAVAAAVSTAFCVALSLRGESAPAGAKRWPWAAALAGALLFGGLNAGVLAGNASPRGNDLLIALALTPTVAAVVIAIRSRSSNGLNGMDVAPGLLATAGLLLILSQPVFRSAGESVALLGAPLCAGLGAVLLRGRAEDTFPLRRAALALGGAATLFVVCALLPPRVEPSLYAVGLDLAVVALTVVSLLQLGARKYSAQFALVPLLLLLEGLVLTRVRPDWEQAGGLVMLLVAGVLLLRTREEPAEETSGRLLA